jgi:general secretion pathway protein B
MSYILDALKKSEKERHRGAAPDVLTVHEADAVPKRRSRLPYLLIAVLLLNAGMLGWWLGPWHAKKTDVVTQFPDATRQPFRAGIADGPADAGKETGMLPAEKSPVQAVMERKEAAPGPGTTMTGPALKPGEGLQQSPRVHAQPETPQRRKHESSEHASSSARISTVSEEKVISLKELPADVRQNIPEMSISVHYYESSPALRMVNINSRTLREGQELSAGLKLEEIIPDGVIFSYQGYRFHLEIQN